ncbi:MAG: hypothetical protein FD135_2308, partial [Comamonadaceae bacterium]
QTMAFFKLDSGAAPAKNFAVHPNPTNSKRPVAFKPTSSIRPLTRAAKVISANPEIDESQFTKFSS